MPSVGLVGKAKRLPTYCLIGLFCKDETPKFTLDNAAPDISKPFAPFLPRIYCTQKLVDTVMAYGLKGVDFIEVE